MEKIYYTITRKAITVYYRHREDLPEVQAMADNLARSNRKLAIIIRVKSRPFYDARRKRIVKPVLAK